MALNILKKRWQKVVFIAIIFVLVIVSIIGFLINLYWSPIVSRKLKETILTSTDSLYSINFSRTSLNVWQGKIIFDGIELIPNLQVYKRRKAQHVAFNSLYTLQVKRLVINHVHPFKLYFNKKLDISDLVINSPTLRIDYEQNRDQDTVIKSKKTPYQLISKVLKSAHVANIVLNDVKFKYIDHSGSKPDQMEFNKLNFVATDFLLDSVSQYDKSRFLFCADLKAELNDYNGTSFDKRYSYKIKTLRLSTQKSQLNLIGMSFLPTKGASEFFKTTLNDCFAIKLDSLQLNNFDFKIYSKYHKIHGSKLRLTKGSVHVYDNPRPNDTTNDASTTFPQVLLRNLKQGISIDTVDAEKIGIYYTQTNKKSGEEGTVIFENTSGRFTNITNDKTALKKDNIAKAKMQTFLMGACKLTVNLSLNLTDPSAAFSYAGQMEGMDLRKINPVAMPLGLVKIASGKMTSLDFHMTADKTSSKGKLTVIYNDLKVSLLKKDSAANKLSKMTFASLFANALIIKRNNPSVNETLRSYSSVYIRKRNSSIYTYMWSSLLVGLKTSAGYDSNTENTVKTKIRNFKQGKPERLARKALRQQRRAERRQHRVQREQEKETKKQEEQQAQ